MEDRKKPAGFGSVLESLSLRVTDWAGSSLSFAIAVAVILVWAVTGPVFHFSDTWQLVINTGTTIVTFLMVFLVQNTQNRDSKAVQLKLDELLRAVSGARDGQFVDLEDRTEQELDAIKEQMLADCDPGETAEEHARHSPLRRHPSRRSANDPARG